MRSTVIGALLGLSLLPAVAFAQTSPQTAAVDNAAPAATSPAATSSATTSTVTTSTGDGITRDQFIQRAKDRAAQRAAVRFDQMDADHDGVLDRNEIRFWRSQHPRRSVAAQTTPPTAQ